MSGMIFKAGNKQEIKYTKIPDIEVKSICGDNHGGKRTREGR